MAGGDIVSTSDRRARLRPAPTPTTRWTAGSTETDEQPGLYSRVVALSGTGHPNRDGGIWDPDNFNRQWRQARGEKFAWVTPKTFRKTVASLIANQYDPQAADQQLGHANDSVTKRH
ncbi:hypothetical protein [Nocardia abscessus]|uniref:hypothetical protein n=1 Tax=Nocardia abscessus TaxID=120957 RepID=UPI002456A8AB|nr:hypothetical protein [Nocardia abscessus]